MRKESRLTLLLAAALLVPAFVLPLWSIRIVAPQYRDGLGMFIGLRDIWGHGQHDIQNINILNHYIGMQAIDPAIVGILRIMPWGVGALIALAVLVAAIGSRKLLIAWLVGFTVAGAAALREFWIWNYDYGHNLDPMAPIKIPGMTYQPPLFGTKQLLNMSTSSFPSWGTLFITLAFLIALATLVREYRRPRADRREPRRARVAWLPTVSRATGLVVLALSLGCRDGGQLRAETVPDFAPDQPRCDYCDGNIPESRFGGEIVTATGDTYRFMSTECMAGFVLAGRVQPADIATMKVVDFNHGERLIDAREAHYVRMAFEKSPNGLNFAAVETEKVARTLHYFLGGERMNWYEVVDFVQDAWELDP